MAEPAEEPRARHTEVWFFFFFFFFFFFAHYKFAS